MLSYKSLLSFVVAFAAASSVVASTIPVARGDYPPPPSAPTCNGANEFCCNTLANPGDSALNVIGPDLLKTLQVGLINGLQCNNVLSIPPGGTW
jgi:hypothetical protein